MYTIINENDENIKKINSTLALEKYVQNFLKTQDIYQNLYDITSLFNEKMSEVFLLTSKNDFYLKQNIEGIKNLSDDKPVTIKKYEKIFTILADENIVWIGDIHADLQTLLDILEKEKFFTNPQKQFVFLGDYIDRGKKWLETLLTLLIIFIKKPNQVILLKGNHEGSNDWTHIDFREGLENFLSKIPKKLKNQQKIIKQDLFNLFRKNIFSKFSLFAISRQGTLAIHGGCVLGYDDNQDKKFVPIYQPPKNLEELVKNIHPESSLWSQSFPKNDKTKESSRFRRGLAINILNQNEVFKTHQTLQKSIRNSLQDSNQNISNTLLRNLTTIIDNIKKSREKVIKLLIDELGKNLFKLDDSTLKGPIIKIIKHLHKLLKTKKEELENLKVSLSGMDQLVENIESLPTGKITITLTIPNHITNTNRTKNGRPYFYLNPEYIKEILTPLGIKKLVTGHIHQNNSGEFWNTLISTGFLSQHNKYYRNERYIIKEKAKKETDTMTYKKIPLSFFKKSSYFPIYKNDHAQIAIIHANNNSLSNKDNLIELDKTYYLDIYIPDQNYQYSYRLYTTYMFEWINTYLTEQLISINAARKATLHILQKTHHGNQEIEKITLESLLNPCNLKKETKVTFSNKHDKHIRYLFEENGELCEIIQEEIKRLYSNQESSSEDEMSSISDSEEDSNDSSGKIVRSKSFHYGSKPPGCSHQGLF